MNHMRTIAYLCGLFLLATLPACDGDLPTAPGDEAEMGWSWSRPRNIWPTSLHEDESGTVWLCDVDGRVLSYDGAKWTQYDTGFEILLRSIWTCGPHIYAAGDEGVILHFDGTAWIRASAPYPVDLYEIWGTGTDNVWAVGHAGTILRLIDGEWRLLSTDSFDSIYAIWGTGPDDMDFGGDDGTMFHFDGEILAPRNTDMSGTVCDLLGTADGRLYAASGDIWVCDDDTWSILVEAEHCCTLATVGNKLFVRQGNWLMQVKNDTLIRVPDQPAWCCRGLGHNSTDRLLTIGEHGAVFEYGDQWSTLRAGEYFSLQSIAGTSANSMYSVGRDGLVLHYDGQVWDREDCGSIRDLFGAWCSDTGKVFVVGHGTIAIRTGGIWDTDPIGDDYWLSTVWGHADDDVYAGGMDGVILHFDGTTWEPMDCPVESTIKGIWGSDPENLFAVTRGYDGEVLHYDGQAWTVLEEFVDNPLWSVWGTGPDNVYTVGWDGGAIYHYDGDIWQVEHQPWDATAHAVHGNGPDNVYVGGYQGGFWHYDGTSWRQIEPALKSQYTPDMWCASDGQLFVPTSLGGILRYGP